MTYKEICKSVRKIKHQYRESNPFRLCKQMGILVCQQNLGTRPDSIKGYFVVLSQIKTIVVNSDLPEVVQQIIVAHELCHAIHHRSEGMQTFHDITLFDSINALEKDANLFAAELLLEDQDVFEALNRDTTFFGAAATLYVPAELLDFKFRLMKWKGYKLTEPPITARNNFLRDIEVPDDADYYC